MSGDKFGVKSLGKIAIVGAGAVGSYYGARLQAAGQDVHFLLRSDFDAVSAEGLKIQSVAGDFELPKVNAYRDPEEIGVVDWVVVAAKATANPAMVGLIRPLLHDTTAILTLQNGLGNDEFFAAEFGEARVLNGLCFVCINRLRAGLIDHTASGLIRVGEYGRGITARLRDLVRVLEAAKVPCEGVESLEKAQWMKLVWNFPFNGLAIAEGGVDTQVLLKERGLEPELRALMAEICDVAAALGHEIPASFIDHQIDITHPMGPYRPSSMIDYVEGRAVEFEAIWDRPLEVAKRLGLEVPRMKALHQRIAERLEQRESSKTPRR